MVDYDKLFSEMTRLSILKNGTTQKNSVQKNNVPKSSQSLVTGKSNKKTENKKTEKKADNKTVSTDKSTNYIWSIFWRLVAIAVIVFACLHLNDAYYRESNYKLTYNYNLFGDENQSFKDEYNIVDSTIRSHRRYYNGELTLETKYDANGNEIK